MRDRELLPDSFYEERRITPKWRRDTLPSAGIWLAEGRYHVAVYGSAAQARLEELGAILVAGVAFDGSHAERPVRGGVTFDLYPLPELRHPRALDALGWAPASN
jgi:sorbitol-specific phosphotransferase system component IIA